jgi:flavin reductase (DIM6/NTAB) family NADH-FMN oxidoreductase RutF
MTGVAGGFDDLVSDIDYPMFIVTASADGDRAGCLVGFVTQASIDPARLLVLLSKQNDTLRVAERADFLGVHFLSTDNHDLAALFGEESGEWTDKFNRCSWSSGPHASIMLDRVRGRLVGKILNRFDAGDHVAHLVEPVTSEVLSTEAPLTFQSVRDLDPGHPA